MLFLILPILKFHTNTLHKSFPHTANNCSFPSLSLIKSKTRSFTFRTFSHMEIHWCLFSPVDTQANFPLWASALVVS